MTIRLNDTLRNELFTEGYFSSFRGGATLKIYSGAQPASANDAPSGTELISIDIPTNDPWTRPDATSDPLTLTKAGVWEGTVSVTGTAGWFRLSHSGNVLDGSVTGVGGGGDLELSNTSLESGGVVTINTFDLTMPITVGNLDISDSLALSVLIADFDSVTGGPLSLAAELRRMERLAIFAGSPPSDANAGTAATKLAEIVLPSDPFSPTSGTPTNQQMIKNGVWEATVDTGGTAGFFRLYEADSFDTDGTGNVEDTSGAQRIQGTITVTGGGGVLELDETALEVDGGLTIDSFTVSMLAS